MAERITYEDKVVNGGITPSGRFIDEDADEIKRVVNANADILENLNNSIMEIFNRTPIPVVVQGGIVIDWQNDFVPGDPLNRTYFARYGNAINGMSGLQMLENGTETGYIPEFTVSKVGTFISGVTIQILYIGSFQIY